MNASLIIYDCDEMRLPRSKKRANNRDNGADDDAMRAQHAAAATVTEKFTMLRKVTTTTNAEGMVEMGANCSSVRPSVGRIPIVIVARSAS